MREIERELAVLIQAGYPILYLVSFEEGRVESRVRAVAEHLSKPLHAWSSTEGATELYSPFAHDDSSPVSYGGGASSQGGGAEGEVSTARDILDHIHVTPVRGIFLLRDFHAHLESATNVRRLRDLVRNLRRQNKTIVIQAPRLVLPPELERDITVIDVALPTSKELGGLIDRFIDQLRADGRFRVELPANTREDLVLAARGLTELEVRRVLSRVVASDRLLDASDIQAVLEEKRQQIRKLGLLEYVDVDAGLADVGGLDGVKQWLYHRRDAFTTRARDYGLPPPKGTMLLGVQGCGKSLCAKAIAASLELPLLRLDVGQIFGAYVGQSEENMRLAIRTTESLAPVVLWIDEIEKGFAGTRGSGASDSGATLRVFATFLTWLQEKTDPVFVVATANRVEDLPPELLRKGRFDEIFFIDLPVAKEREEIFAIHLRRRRREPGAFDLARLAAASEGYSGAEIEQAIVEGMYAGFSSSREFTTEDLLEALQSSVPLSRTMAEDIAGLRAWASTRARPASSA